MMNSISLKAKVDVNGKLSLQLPKEYANRELDIVVVYQEVEKKEIKDLHQVVDSFYGCLENDPILLEEENQKETA